MNRTHRAALLTLGVLAVSLLAGAATEPHEIQLTAGATPSPQKVPISDIGAKFELIGDFGSPIGTFMTIEGVADKQWMGSGWPVVIDTVNGTKLAQPLTVGVDGTPSLTPGQRYTLRGYESCGMWGKAEDPKNDAGGDARLMAQQPLQFRHWFQVTKVK